LVGLVTAFAAGCGSSQDGVAQTADAGSDAGGTIVDLSPATTPTGTASPFSAVGMEVTFASDTPIVAVEINAQMALGTMTGTIWDDTSHAVVATGSVAPSTTSGPPDVWHRSDLAFTARAGHSYVIGGIFSRGWSGESWSGVAFPYSVGNVTVSHGCAATASDGGAVPFPPCDVTEAGDTTIALRIVEP
jgi:hypothetical protein